MGLRVYVGYLWVFLRKYVAFSFLFSKPRWVLFSDTVLILALSDFLVWALGFEALVRAYRA